MEYITATERQRVIEAVPRRQMDLPMMVIDEAVEGRISLEQLSKGLTLRIPRFDGQANAVVMISVGGENPDTGFAQRLIIESATADTLIPIPAEQAVNFRGQRMLLRYLVNLEHSSGDNFYFAEDEIYNPVVDEAEGGVIPASAANGGVHLRLRASRSLTNGALVSVYMHGSTADGCLVRHVLLEQHEESEDLVMFIEPIYLKPNKYGAIRLIYSVEKADRKWTSILVELQVEGEIKAPEPVYVKFGYVIGDILLPVDESRRIPVVFSTDGMSVNDVVTFIFASANLETSYILRQTLSPQQIGQELRVLVPVEHWQLHVEVSVMTLVERASGGVIGSRLRRLYPGSTARLQ